MHRELLNSLFTPFMILCGGLLLGGCSQPANTPSASAQAAAAAMQAIEGAPPVPELAVVRPFFQTSLGSNNAGETIGSAFVVGLGEPSRKLVLSAFTLLGNDGKWQRIPTAGELNDILQSITLGDAFGSSDGVFPAEKFLLLPESGPIADADHPAGDVLAMLLPPKSRLSPLPLSPDTPEVGERVWLCAALFAGAPPSQKQHAAKVTAIELSGDLQYVFENEQISFEGTAGAPLLNDAGEVVAIHLTGSAAHGVMTGVGNPVSRFLPHLTAALDSMPQEASNFTQSSAIPSE
jgi:hypothetical protein